MCFHSSNDGSSLIGGTPSGHAATLLTGQPPELTMTSTLLEDFFRQHIAGSIGAQLWNPYRNRRTLARAGPGEDTEHSPSTDYSDSFTDLLFIQMCRTAYSRVAGWDSPLPFSDGYRAMVQVSRALMASRSPAEQRAAVLQGFPEVPAWFRRLFPYSPTGAALNAAITPRFFSWLVGPCAVEEEAVPVVARWPVAATTPLRGETGFPEGTKSASSRDGQTGEVAASGSGSSRTGGEVAMARSAVRIERCRYLAESGCVGMCVNLCKAPTQYFFTEQLGVPLTMEPNFSDLSCRMVFGQPPPPLEEDSALQQPCLASCASAEGGPGPLRAAPASPAGSVCPQLP